MGSTQYITSLHLLWYMGAVGQAEKKKESNMYSCGLQTLKYYRNLRQDYNVFLLKLIIMQVGIRQCGLILEESKCYTLNETS